MQEQYEIYYRNRGITHDLPCAFEDCENITSRDDYYMGFEIAIEGKQYLYICDDCARKHVPDKVAKVELLREFAESFWYEKLANKQGFCLLLFDEEFMLHSDDEIRALGAKRREVNNVIQFPNGNHHSNDDIPDWLMGDDSDFLDFLSDNYPVSDRVQLPHELQAKQQTLAHYAEVDTPQHYVQIDGFTSTDGSADCVINPNGERNSIMCGDSFELWRGDYTLRLHVNPNADRADVIELLEDILKYARDDENFFDSINYPDEPPF